MELYVLTDDMKPIKANSLEEYALYANDPENLNIAMSETKNVKIYTMFLGTSPYFEINVVDKCEENQDQKFFRPTIREALRLHNRLVNEKN